MTLNVVDLGVVFPISRDPPEGGTGITKTFSVMLLEWFPISRDPPEGGTWNQLAGDGPIRIGFPMSRDPPEGGTIISGITVVLRTR